MQVETSRTWLYGCVVDNLLSLLFFVSLMLYYSWLQPEYLVWVFSSPLRCTDSHEIHNELIFSFSTRQICWGDKYSIL